MVGRVPALAATATVDEGLRVKDEEVTETGSKHESQLANRERRAFEFIVRHPLAVIVFTAALTVGFASQLPHLELDPDTEAYIPKGHPIRVFWKQAKQRFSLGKDIFVGIVADGPDGIFTPEILGGIASLTDGIGELDTVISDDVRSLSTSEAILGTEEGIEIEPFFEEPPATLEEAAAIREKVFSNGVYLDRLVSRDASIGAIIVQAHDAYDPNSPYAHPVAVFQEVVDYVKGHSIANTRIVVAGNSAVEAAFGRQMASDLASLIPSALMVVVVTLFLCFRTGPAWKLLVRAAVLFAVFLGWNLSRSGDLTPGYLALVALVLAMLSVRGVLLPSLVVVMSLVWTWGFQAMLEMPIYIAGTLVPPILMAIGCADGIHILERYFDQASGMSSRDEVIVSTMVALWRPVLFTSITTAIGFGSLTLGHMTVQQVFGFTTAFGILVAMLMSLTLLPALLALMPLPRGARSARKTALMQTSLMWLGREIRKHRKSVIAISMMLGLVLIVGATGLRVDYSWVESLEPGSDVLQADRLMRTRHGGTMPMNIVVTSEEPERIKDPALLRGIDRVLRDLAAHPHVGDTRSIAEYIKRMNEAMNENRPEELRIPDSRELVAQYLLLYSMMGNPDELNDLVDFDYQGAQLGVLLRSDWLSDMGEVIELADALLDEHVRSLGVDAIITGSVMIQKTVFDLILESQVTSLVTATVLVLLFMIVLFRSLTDALICMVPTTFTAVANFGGMALLGVPLGPAEAMISAISLGIGIDYSIHLMSRLREVVRQGKTVDEGIVEAMRTTGRAILFNGLVVVAGFTVLALSKTPSNATFGIAVAANMALCCVAALVLLPASLSFRKSP
jgi:predicted RND superfamily exporter protein